LLTHIDVESDNPFTVPIVGATPKDSILFKQITGLNPPNRNLFIGDYSRDGGIFQGRRVGVRNVVITMELNPNPALGETVSGLRENLYKAFIDPLAESDYLKLNFHLDDGRVLFLVGYTETFDTEIFSADTLAQASILCPDPYLRDDEATILTNPSGWTTVPFAYTGTAETGFEVRIEIHASTPKLILANNTVTDDTANPNYARGRMILNRAFVNGDVVTINTVRGFRRIWLTPAGGGPVISIYGSMTPTSRWLELHSQANTMKVYGSTPASLPAGITSLTYVQAYWGI
jgi:hypothetical protein